jgi:selenocysteine-specific elongation factor
MTNLVPVHVGLMGHIDHGKTALAKSLSEHVSTAGLDKHPQAKARGITIDLGFSMFRLGPYLVTLVDAPGHADLIRSVVASANIIDAAILVVAADEGPKVQTGEHILVLQSMGVSRLVVAITKTDLVDATQLDRVEARMRTVIGESAFERVEFARVSAMTGEGIDRLKEQLLAVVEPSARDVSGPLLIPLDHAFLVKGHGTVVTGTILRGSVRVGDTLELVPQGQMGTVRSIETFSESVSVGKAGDRVGVNVPELDSSSIHRGDYLSAPRTIKKTSAIIVSMRANPFYRDRITNRMVLSATVGMPTVTAEIVTVERTGEAWVIRDDPVGTEFEAALLLSEMIPAQTGMRVLLIRTDLAPNRVRIVGSGRVLQIPEHMLLLKRRQRVGRVSRLRNSDVLVEGLATKRETAASLTGAAIRTEKGVPGLLGAPFGTRGVLSATFNSSVSEGDVVVHETLKEEEYSFGRGY